MGKNALQVAKRRIWILTEHCRFTEIIDSVLSIVNDMGRAKQYCLICLFLSVLVNYVFLTREKNLTLKTCAPDFSARSMTKLYAKFKGVRAISLFDFPKTWQVWAWHPLPRLWIRSAENNNNLIDSQYHISLIINMLVFFPKQSKQSYRMDLEFFGLF